MAALTFVTACAPYHRNVLERAAASVAAQTVPCKHIVMYDHECRGTGVMRNLGLAQVDTPFVSFLDADDWLSPDFAARMIGAWQGDRYVYCDHWQGDKIVSAPSCPFVERTWHVVTALVPTLWALAVGGFDTELPAAEDTHFYLKLMTSGYCGRRLAMPLFHYGTEGERSKGFVNSPHYIRVMDRFTQEFGGKQMSCCGENAPIDDKPSGDQQMDDVIAQAMWGGNRMERGLITGRMYPRTGNGKRLWIDPRDANAAPHLFRVVPAVEFPPVPEFATLDDLGAMMRYMTPIQDDHARFIPKPDMRPVEPVQVAPNVRKALGLYQAAAHG